MLPPPRYTTFLRNFLFQIFFPLSSRFSCLAFFLIDTTAGYVSGIRTGRQEQNVRFYSLYSLTRLLRCALPAMTKQFSSHVLYISKQINYFKILYSSSFRKIINLLLNQDQHLFKSIFYMIISYPFCRFSRPVKLRT